MYDNIPNELKSLPQWVCWQSAPDETREGKTKKIPINPKTGGQAQSNNEETWCDFDTAAKNADKFSGIGFMLANGYFGVDLDNCEGSIEDYKIGDVDNIVAEFIYTLGSYAEYSQSGKGIHVICRGKLPPVGRRKGSVEMYELGRFFVMTGNIASQYTEIQDGTEAIKTLHEKYIGGGTAPSTGISLALPLNLSESEIIKLAENSKQGTTFRQLYSGQWETLHTSQSEADLALCNMLAFWTGCNQQLMDKLFRGSGLMRPKWGRKQNGSTYGSITIDKAVKGCNKVYEPEAQYQVTIGQAPVKPKYKKLYSFDDTGNAERFADTFGERLRYNYISNCWMYYDGRKWSFDTTGSAKRMCDEVVEEMKHDLKYYIESVASEEDAEEIEKNFLKHLKYSRSSRAKIAMVKEAEHKLPITQDQLDTQKMLLCTPNGIINLVTGELEPHDVKKFITKIAYCEYTDKTDYPLWDSFLNDIFDGDKELIRYMQKAIGYSLTGSTKEQCLFFCYGVGQNGKSTFLETISDALGDYATNIQPETIMVKQQAGGASGDVARLKGSRFVNSAEPNQGVKLNESLVKQLTGGDKVTARKMYENEFEFMPEFKLWMSTNYKPVIRGTDVGIWRRIRLIPFTVTIPDKKVDRNLKYKLRQELPGIFKWAVEGCLMWQREGLAIPKAIVTATSEYKSEMDAIGSFLETCCILGGEGEERGQDVYLAYVTWAKDNNEFEMSSRKFNTEMLKRFERRKSSTDRIYQKISLLPAYRGYGIQVKFNREV